MTNFLPKIVHFSVIVFTTNKSKKQNIINSLSNPNSINSLLKIDSDLKKPKIKICKTTLDTSYLCKLIAIRMIKVEIKEF